jgi:hypothetical protein
VTGGGNTIYLDGASTNVVELYATGDNADQVNGSGGTIALNNARANVTGNSDTIEMLGSSGNWLSLSGNSEMIAFAAQFGQSYVSGFNSTDTMAFSMSDFVDFQALQSKMSQSGADTIITLDASNSVTLANTKLTDLASSQFKFI